MTDKQIIIKRIKARLTTNYSVVSDLTTVVNNLMTDNVSATDLSTLYIALEELKLLYNIDEKEISKVYSHTMKINREELNYATNKRTNN